MVGLVGSYQGPSGFRGGGQLPPQSWWHSFASGLVVLTLPRIRVVGISDPAPKGSYTFRAIVKPRGFRVHAAVFPPAFLCSG